ncbi:type II secretion system GspH family protein [Geomonas subterranea]|uniref:Type II secretion system GspH family protein n=1 Tax=Geomonas subterranea TaxID=2847989 RepID=A0ABX8LJF6_9BACT|nr:type II secretion system protein [Geomonas subterranea]QXE91481.1 type II secretion system GspH family protein [Geomonas subterranea]QXM10431.1 type II secretion system GspH family protein [Geomonas subterranea]
MSGLRTARGYTLVELIVVMLIFAVVMSLISISFSNIVRSAGQLGRRVETDIGGLIGLELMRGDLELGGFGLPYTVPPGVAYTEARDDLLFVPGYPGAKPSTYNDAGPPAAFRVGSNAGFNGSDYLVVKGTPLGDRSVCRSWCYLNFSGVTRPSRVEPELKIGDRDRAVVLRTGVGADGRPVRDLVVSGSNFTFFLDNKPDQDFAPKQRSDSYLVYGVAGKTDGGAWLNFPFNRSDYYINRKPDGSQLCNRGTGTLYKTTVDQQGGSVKYPLLDCAADMQVVLYMDSNLDGAVDYHTDTAGADVSADDLREQLKEIRVYIMAQEGKRDPGYQYPVRDAERAIVVGDPELDDYLAHVWTARGMSATFGPDWRNYRWKLYTIVVRPKNL